MNTPAVLDKAKAQLVLDHPFFASLLLGWGLTARSDIPSYAVDRRGKLFYNPEWAETHDVGDAVFGLAHEVSHVMFQHFARLNGRNPRKANLAQDAVVNETLIAAGIGKPAPSDFRWPKAEEMTWEQVYDLLPDSAAEDGYGGGGRRDDLLDEGEPMDEATQAELEAKVKVDIAQAAQAARMQGKMPANLQRLVDSILQVKTPWYDILERLMRSIAKDEYSWTRPNRRFVGSGVYLPSAGDIPRMGAIVLVVDTSGSIDHDTLRMFAGHMNRILETCTPERLVVLYADAAVGGMDEYTPDDLPAVFNNVVGGGGTDFRPAFEWVSSRDTAPDVLVYLTDGIGGFPSRAPDYPTVWLMTTDTVAPFGTTVRFEE